jgi:hypothetical protein
MKDWDVSILPAVRVSDRTTPEIRAYMSHDGLIVVSAEQNGKNFNIGTWETKAGIVLFIRPALHDIKGRFIFHFDFFDGKEVCIGQKEWIYEVITTGLTSSKLLDGCWIDLYHWSEDEGRWFNKALKELTEEDWKDQIRSMARVGIRGIVIQNLFYINEYVGTNSLTLENYHGEAFYPSELYPGRYDIRAKDVLRAILEAADECGMHVLIGVGLFAWFDFSAVSLEWHKRVARELFDMYGHHSSFYGYYVSEEIPGSLYDDFDHVDNGRWKEIASFFQEFKAYVNGLSPTKPVALAPNNIRFHEYETEWCKILENIDILLPFAFARDMENLNINEISDICSKSKTHFWVDMEIFQNPFDNGLIPKQIDELIGEIRIYDNVEQIYGYEYTGHLNHPECPHDLGGKVSKELYSRYQEYFDKTISTTGL